MKMLYSKDQLPEIFKRIDDLIIGSGFKSYKEPAPKYIMGPNWTDELREKNGYALIDGEWFKVDPVQNVWDDFKKDLEKLMDDISDQRKKMDVQQQRLYEMEYGLRVARKSLEKSLQLQQELLKNGL
jgi:hypothetical protein